MNDINPHLMNFHRWVQNGFTVDIPMENDETKYYEHRGRFNALAEALALTERGRREGEIGYLEVLRARQTVAQATRDLAVARVAALAAISTYNQAQGVLP